MDFKLYFPELNEGQLRMLENYIEERERVAMAAASKKNG
jgi:hypothetical protein